MSHGIEIFSLKKSAFWWGSASIYRWLFHSRSFSSIAALGPEWESQSFLSLVQYFFFFFCGCVYDGGEAERNGVGLRVEEWVARSLRFSASASLHLIVEQFAILSLSFRAILFLFLFFVESGEVWRPFVRIRGLGLSCLRSRLFVAGSWFTNTREFLCYCLLWEFWGFLSLGITVGKLAVSSRWRSYLWVISILEFRIVNFLQDHSAVVKIALVLKACGRTRGEESLCKVHEDLIFTRSLGRWTFPIAPNSWFEWKNKQTK